MKYSKMNRWALGMGGVLAGALGWGLGVQPRTLQSGGAEVGERLDLRSPVPVLEVPKEREGRVPSDSSSDRGRGSAGAAPASEGTEELLKCLQRGREALELKEFGKAREAFEKALSENAQDRRALSALAWLEQREQNWERSEELLRKALLRAVEDSALWLSLGVSLMEQEKWEGATAAFCQAVALEPKNARPRRLLAVTLGRRGWMDGAEQEFRRAIELEPEEGGAHYNLALLYLERKPPLIELARRHYYRALDLGVASDPAVAAKLGAVSVGKNVGDSRGMPEGRSEEKADGRRKSVKSPSR